MNKQVEILNGTLDELPGAVKAAEDDGLVVTGWRVVSVGEGVGRLVVEVSENG